MAEEKKLQVFPVGITEKEIKKIADQAIADSGAANEVPLATIADAGKVIKVGDDGKYELAEASGGGSGGGSLPVSVYTNVSGSSGGTIAELIASINGYVPPSSFNSTPVYDVYLENITSGQVQSGFAKFYASNYGSLQYHLIEIASDGYLEFMYSADTDYVQTSATMRLPFCPSLSDNDNTKTYTLKCVNGALEWVLDA